MSHAHADPPKTSPPVDAPAAQAHSHAGRGHIHNHRTHGGHTAERALWVALILNAAFLVAELIVGLWANSLALLSDAGHMASDVAALGLALVAQRLVRSRTGPAFTFGLRRVPVLGAFGNAVSLVIIAVLILWEAWHRLQHPPPVLALPVLVAGVLGLFVNLISAWYLHRSSDSSLNIRGAILHLLADALGSVGAIVAALVLMLTGWAPIDALVSVVIAVLLLASTWPLLRDTTKVLLQGAPSDCDPLVIEDALASHELVEEVADLHIWQIDQGQIVLSAVLVTRQHSLEQLQAAAQELKSVLLEKFQIQHATLEWCTPDSPFACTMGASQSD
jgi:cobalt-zinc-cadmium efflux system protein